MNSFPFDWDEMDAIGHGISQSVAHDAAVFTDFFVT